MHDHRRFPAESMGRLHSPERMGRQPAGPLVDLVAAFNPSVVLDVGAGTGYFALPLAARLPSARVIALDVEPRMLDELGRRSRERQTSGAVETVVAEASALPFADRALDLALLVNLYHELDDRSAHLRELRRVLRPGGHLVVCDWHPHGDLEAGPPAAHRIARETAEAELGSAGFAAATEHALYPAYWTLSATAP
jgi:ubiquinone/menaquinone biosynthesis C-methylase UbiE